MTIAEFVKKTMLNYREVPGGNSDPECTHVILAREEYEKLVAEKQRAVTEAAETKKSASLQIDSERRNAQAKMEQAKQEAQATVKSMQETLDDAEKDIEYLKGLNENLLRIARERANADRKLKPKKGHTGYVVVVSSEKEYRYKVNRREWDTVMLWETVLQSPYSIEFTEEQAREQTKELEEGAYIERLGITAYLPGKYEEVIETRAWQLYGNRNVMLEKRLRANYKAGYWEVIISHTKPLSPVPSEMRAR